METLVPQNNSLTGEFQKGMSLEQVVEFRYKRKKEGCECGVTKISSRYQKQFLRMAGQKMRIHEVCIF